MSDTTRAKSAVPGAPPVPVDHTVAMLRERLYGAISCLALLAVLTRYTETVVLLAGVGVLVIGIKILAH